MIRKESALAGHIVGEGNPVRQPHLCFRDGTVACYSLRKLMTTSNSLARKPLKPRHRQTLTNFSSNENKNKKKSQTEQESRRRRTRTRTKEKTKTNKDKQRQTRTKTTTTEALFPSTRQTGLLFQAGCFSIGLPWYPPLSSKNNIWNLVLCQKSGPFLFWCGTHHPSELSSFFRVLVTPNLQIWGLPSHYGHIGIIHQPKLFGGESRTTFWLGHGSLPRMFSAR